MVRVVVRVHSLATLGLYACCGGLSSTGAAIILSLAVVSARSPLILAGAGEGTQESLRGCDHQLLVCFAVGSITCCGGFGSTVAA